MIDNLVSCLERALEHAKQRPGESLRAAVVEILDKSSPYEDLGYDRMTNAELVTHIVGHFHWTVGEIKKLERKLAKIRDSLA